MAKVQSNSLVSTDHKSFIGDLFLTEKLLIILCGSSTWVYRTKVDVCLSNF